MKKTMIFAFFLTAIFSLTFFKNVCFAQEPTVKAPENFQDAKDIGEKTLDAAKNDFPGIIKNIWQNEVWPIWKKIGEYLRNVWNSSLGQWIENIWQKFKNFFQNEIEKRKPLINEEFKKEKTEIKEGLKTEVPAAGKSLWEKIKEIAQ